MNAKTDARRTDDQGVLAVSIDSIATATEKTLAAYFGVVRDVRTEVAQRVGSVIDWVEGVEQGAIRLSRSMVQRTDEVATAWIDANEQFALGIVRAIRSTGEGATQFASRTAASLTSTRRDRETVAQA
jgi:hypothetical protein